MESLADEARAQVVALARETYAGLNDQHLTEKLQAHGLALHRTTVRRILVTAEGRATPRRRVPRHRRRRERYPCEGLLLQADASPHRWFGPEGPEVALVGAIDDATGTVPWAVFRAHEDAAGYLLLLRGIATTRGLPHALYVDRHGLFQKRKRQPLTLEEELAGGRLPTQVGRALEALGIQRIDALSPQAKGRIERLWRTLQDRLVAELRLAGITTLAAANARLPGFLAAFNARFAVPAADPTPAWRPLPAGLDLERVLCFPYERVVRPDNTLAFAGRALQLLPGQDRLSWARARVQVHERLDGSLAVYYQDALIGHAAAPADAPTLRARTGPRPGAGPPQAPQPQPLTPPTPHARRGSPPLTPPLAALHDLPSPPPSH